MACAAAMLADVAAVARGPESQAFRIACWLAVANQASASTAVINYAPEVLSSSLGVSAAGDATLFSLVISAAKVLGVVAAAAAVDRLGRRPLLLWGGTGCGAALLAAGVALVARSVPGFLSCLALFILAFSSSWAGLFWWVTSAAAAAAIKCAAHAHTYMHTHAGPYALGLHAVARSIQISQPALLVLRCHRIRMAGPSGWLATHSLYCSAPAAAAAATPSSACCVQGRHI